MPTRSPFRENLIAGDLAVLSWETWKGLDREGAVAVNVPYNIGHCRLGAFQTPAQSFESLGPVGEAIRLPLF